MSLFPCSRAFVQLLGCGSGDLSPGIMVVFDNKRFLFNCGEGTQRFCIEWKLRMSKITEMFLTHLHPETSAGIHGMLMTIADTPHQTIHVRGPSGLAAIDSAIAELVPHKDELRLKLVELDPTNPQPFVDDVATVSPFFITCEGHSDNIAYRLKMPDIPGKFDTDKAEKLGVPKGKLWGELKKGNSVQNKSGETIQPFQCVGEPTPGPEFIVVRIPAIEFLDSVFQHPNLSQKELLLQTNIAFHIAEDAIFTNAKYQAWISHFPPTTLHVVVNKNSAQYPVFKTFSVLSARLSTVDDDIFPIAHSQPSVPLFESIQAENIIRGSPLLKYQLYPTSGIRLDRSQELSPMDLQSISEEAWKVGGEEFHISLELYREKKIQTEGKQEGQGESDFTLVFLGTGSAKPSTYRSVTGTYLSYENNFHMLLDCGEGSYGQLFRIFGSEKANSIILSLDVIWISHVHTDHNFGLVPILKRRYELLKEANQPLKPTLVIGPTQLRSWLHGAASVYGDLLYEFDDCRDYLSSNPRSEFFSTRGFSSFATVPVVHCEESFGLITQRTNGHKIVCSGDTWKCDALVEAGHDCDILIHDSTFEDGLEADAEAKLHSTISQAVSAAKSMRAKFLFLTHFSQRYPKFPVLPDLGDCELHIGVAFDMMKVTNRSLPRLDALRQSIQFLFNDIGQGEEGESNE